LLPLRLILLVLPLATYGVALKIGRLVHLDPGPSAGDALVLLGSDVLFQGAFAAACAFALGAAARLGRAHLVLWGLQVLAALMSLALTVAHAFFLVSGKSLDWGQFAFALAHAGEMRTVVASELTGAWRIALVGPPLFLLTVPRLLPRWLAGRLAAVPRLGEGPPPSWRGLSAVGLVAAGLCALSTFPRLSDRPLPLARDPVLNLLIGAFTPDPFDEVLEVEAEPRPTGPTRLERIEGAPRPNLVVILLESTRAASVSAYDEERGVTPYLGELARRSLLVERAYALIPHTSKALVSVLCGIEPRLAFEVVEAGRGAMPGRCLADLLGEHGYETIYFQAATKKYEKRPGLVRNMGYAQFRPGDEMPSEGFEKANYFGYEDDIMLGPTRAWLEGRDPGAPFFATFLTNTPHHEYRAPKRYGRLQLAEGDRENRYLNSVRYLDFFVRSLMGIFEELGAAEGTVFLIVGDHGQGFGEHGLWIHDDIMYDEGLKVPLILYRSGHADAGRRVPGPVSQLDIAPTLLDALGFGYDKESYPGRSFLTGDPRAELHAACYRKFQCLAGIRGHRKLIHYFGNRPDELFDLATDPGERRNLAPTARAEVLKWGAELRAWSRAVHQMHKPFGEAALKAYVGREAPKPRHPADIRFGDIARLIGYDTPKRAVRAAGRAKATLYFEVLRAPVRGTTMVTKGKTGRQEKDLDHVPARGLYPLRDWRAGDFVTDTVDFRVPRGWRAKVMGLHVGFRDAEGRALPTTGADQVDGLVHVGELRVTPRKRKRRQGKR
jgi:lipoteichoic acid synthase